MTGINIRDIMGTTMSQMIGIIVNHFFPEQDPSLSVQFAYKKELFLRT